MGNAEDIFRKLELMILSRDPALLRTVMSVLPEDSLASRYLTRGTRANLAKI